MAKIVKDNKNSLEKQMPIIYLKQYLAVAIGILLSMISIYFLFSFFFIAIYITFLNGKKKRIRSGIEGEKEIRDVLLNELPEEYIIIPDLNISNNNKIAQIDHVIIGKSKIFVVEAKNFKGKIYGDIKDNKLVFEKEFSNKREYRYNPIKQNETHMWAVKNLLNNHMNKKYFVENIVVFGSKTSDISISNARNNAMKIDKVTDIIKRLDNGRRLIEEQDKDKIIEVILEDSSNNTKGVQTYSTSFKDIITDKDVKKLLKSSKKVISTACIIAIVFGGIYLSHYHSNADSDVTNMDKTTISSDKIDNYESYLKDLENNMVRKLKPENKSLEIYGQTLNNAFIGTPLEFSTKDWEGFYRMSFSTDKSHSKFTYKLACEGNPYKITIKDKDWNVIQGETIYPKDKVQNFSVDISKGDIMMILEPIQLDKTDNSKIILSDVVYR